ncbi:uncharacterized protein V1518DRAFT_425841 [Limtongia smithiae]|uniref:uncharacterized protein n=1 Tax=Limtongia smithiae TaxID=1125753 RepID=UPI0034CE7C10
MLSPTLPLIFTELSGLSGSDAKTDLKLPSNMLSPTLPPIFDSESLSPSKSHDTSSENLQKSSDLLLNGKFKLEDVRRAEPARKVVILRIPSKYGKLESTSDSTTQQPRVVKKRDHDEENMAPESRKLKVPRSAPEAVTTASRGEESQPLLRAEPPSSDRSIKQTRSGESAPAASSKDKGQPNVSSDREAKVSQITKGKVDWPSSRSDISSDTQVKGEKSLSRADLNSSSDTPLKVLKLSNDSSLASELAAAHRKEEGQPLSRTDASSSLDTSISRLSTRKTSSKEPSKQEKVSQVADFPADKSRSTPPPSSQSLRVSTVSASPGTPGTKKSSLAEYNNKRRRVELDEHGNATPDLQDNNKKSASTSRVVSTNKASAGAGLSGADRTAIQLLERKSQRWISLATSRKHESDRQKENGDMVLAALYATDALLAYVVAFDYDDKTASIRGRVPSDKNWQTLVPFVRHVINLLEQAKANPIIGMSYYIRSIIYLRMAGFQQLSVKSLQQQQQQQSIATRASESPETSTPGSNSNGVLQVNNTSNEIGDQLLKFSKNVESAAIDFQRGSKYLTLDSVIEQFGETWSRRTRGHLGVTPNLAGPVIFGGSHQGPGLRPCEDSFTLPIQMNSTIRETAAFSVSLLREWASKQNLQFETILAKGLQNSE